MEAFRRMGEPATGVIHKKNKFTGDPAGYCFVQFPTDEMALNAMHKLNGKVVPQTNPVSITTLTFYYKNYNCLYLKGRPFLS